MPRAPRQLTSEFFYHVTARTNNRERFPKSPDFCWSIFLEQLAKVAEDYNARVISFVMMLNHFHMLIWTPDSNLDAIMNYFMRESSKRIGSASRRINHLFGNRYDASLLKREEHLYHAYKYVYLNPVVAGISERSENYPYSTLNYMVRDRRLPFLLHDHLAQKRAPIPRGMKNKLDWLNRTYEEKQRQVIQKSLRRNVCEFSKQTTFARATRELTLIENS